MILWLKIVMPNEANQVDCRNCTSAEGKAKPPANFQSNGIFECYYSVCSEDRVHLNFPVRKIVPLSVWYVPLLLEKKQSAESITKIRT
jgi:hypothetical protein